MGLSKKIDVSGVLATGRPLVVDARVDLPAFGSHSFPRGAHVALEIERVDRGIGVDGRIDAVATGVCDRCLADVERPLALDVAECFTAPRPAADPLGENNVLDGPLLDVADLTRQLVDSALPMLLLCAEDCPGLCPVCGRPRREDGCTCSVSLER